METKVLTISGLMAFLSQIEQLKGLDMTVAEEDNGIVISIGEDTYLIESEPDSIVEVDGDVIDSVETINEDGWDDIEDDVVDEFVEGPDEAVEGGIIKELIKTLAIGGLVRLTKNAISKA